MLNLEMMEAHLGFLEIRCCALWGLNEINLNILS